MILQQKSKDHSFQLPKLQEKSQEKQIELSNSSVFKSNLHHSYIPHLNFDRQIYSESINLKNQRYDSLILSSKRDIQTLNLLKGTLRKSLQHRKDQNNQKQKYCQESSIICDQSRLKKAYPKNSLMNNLFSKHRKASKITFEDSKCQLITKFHKTNLCQKQQLAETKSLSGDPSEKIIALLSDRPFKKTSPLKCNVGKLKMNQKIKELVNKNVILNPSINKFRDSMNKDEIKKKQTEDQQLTMNLKNNRSLSFIEKPFIRTDLLKVCTKSVNKLDRFSSIEKLQKSWRKKFILLSPAEEKSSNNLDTVISTSSNHSNTNLINQNQNKKQNPIFESRQKKCQERILSDLIKLEQIRNKQFYAENKILHLKSSRIFAQNFKQIKLPSKDKNKLKNHKVKYVVKFKTEPKQNAKQKLEVKLSQMIPEIQKLRNKLFEETKFEGSAINGVAQSLKQRPVQKSQRILKGLDQDQSIKTGNKGGHLVLEREVSGWDTGKETESRDHWNFHF